MPANGRPEFPGFAVETATEKISPLAGAMATAHRDSAPLSGRVGALDAFG